MGKSKIIDQSDCKDPLIRELKGMRSTHLFSIANTLGKGMNPIILPPAMGK